MQAIATLKETEWRLSPLSQMRSANKKHGNIGDVELMDGSFIIEAWDAKYGKPYLYDELKELDDKLTHHSTVEVAGFVVDKDMMIKSEITERVAEVVDNTNTEILLFNFSDWVDYQVKRVADIDESVLAKEWVTAVVESFSLRRLDIAPIDEPCEEWLRELESILSKE